MTANTVKKVDDLVGKPLTYGGYLTYVAYAVCPLSVTHFS